MEQKVKKELVKRKHVNRAIFFPCSQHKLKQIGCVFFPWAFWHNVCFEKTNGWSKRVFVYLFSLSVFIYHWIRFHDIEAGICGCSSNHFSIISLRIFQSVWRNAKAFYRLWLLCINMNNLPIFSVYWLFSGIHLGWSVDFIFTCSTCRFICCE